MKNRINSFYIMFLLFAVLSRNLLAMEDEIATYYKQGVISFKPEAPPTRKTDRTPLPFEDSLSFDKTRNRYYYIEKVNNNDDHKINGFWKESNNSS